MTGRRMRRAASLILCLVIALLPVCTAVAGHGGGRRHEKAPEKTQEEVTLITCQPEAVTFMIQGSEVKTAPAFMVEINVPDGAAVNCVWYLDDTPCGSGTEFTLQQYAEMTPGVYRIRCHVTCWLQDGTLLEEDSTAVSWICCTGIRSDTVLTFSDVHGDYDHIGRAIQEVMDENDGKIPALIICIGDWANESKAVGKESTASVCIPAVLAQAGGIDTVLVAGNHENGEAADEYNEAQGFGADGSGILFLSGTADTGSSAEISNLAVFGIPFDDIADGQEYSYAGVLKNLESFLESQKDSGRIIVIASHTGLHTLGIQPGSSAKRWSGKGKYNIDRSAEMVSLLNRYAETYGMNIIFLFGHNHSRSETEFNLDPGEMIYSTQEYEQGTVTRQTLSFTYAHAGYLTDSSHGTKHYSVLRLQQGEIKPERKQLAE